MRRSPSNARVDILFERAHAPDPRLQKVAATLAGAGYEVRILSWDRSGSLPAVERDGRLEVRRVGPTSVHGRGLVQLWYLARAVARYVPLVRSRRPGILHAVDLPMLLAAILMWPVVGRPVIVYEAFEIYSIMESRKYPAVIIGILAILERLLPRFADVVFVVGDERQAWFAARGIDSVVVGNWIDPPDGGLQPSEARRRLGITDDRLVILYAGGLDPSRDVEPLLRHAERVPGDLVLVAGRGMQEARVSQAALNIPNLRYLGYLSDPTPATTACDVLYYSLVEDHPYARHAAPNNLHVAIAYAKPLIHRGQGEIGLLASRFEIGQRFHDDASLDAAIDSMRDPAARQRIGAVLRGLQASYSWARAAENLLRAYPRPKTMAARPSTKGP